MQRITNAVFIVCALVITGLLVRRELFMPVGRTITHEIENWRDFAHGQVMGPPGGTATLIVFSDFECPACRQLSRHLDSVRAAFPRLTIYYRNLPIPSHPGARRAAFAAECAGRQGRFEAASKRLFTEVPAATELTAFSRALQLSDAEGFARCVRDSLPAAIVRRDSADAARLQATGTPTLLLNGRVIRGTPPLPTLLALVGEASKTGDAR